jgi:glutamate-ammonia-ligase adenylyltransferase
MRATLRALCPDASPEAVEAFGRMDEDYFALHPSERIAAHIRMSCQLSREEPVRVDVERLPEGDFEITVVGYDHFSELSVLSGLITSFGLDIREAHIHTFAPRPAGESASVPLKIVDVFRVAPLNNVSFDAARQQSFRDELTALARLLGEGRVEEARERVARRFLEFVEGRKDKVGRILYPVDVAFAPAGTSEWTMMDVRSQDTPGFLYALTSALALRGIYVHKVDVGSVGDDAVDRFAISGRHGGRIDAPEQQAALRMAVSLIKQFIHFLPGAPDPHHAVRYFDQFLDALMERQSEGAILSFFAEEESLGTLARLLGSSRFLWEDFLRMQLENLLPLLHDLGGVKLRGRDALREEIAKRCAAAEGLDAKKAALNEFKDREMFLIDMSHLLDPAVGLGPFSKALTDLADAVVGEAIDLAARELAGTLGRPLDGESRPCPSAVFGLGKFGGGEMGYGSDIELLFAFGAPGTTSGPRRVENGEYFETLARLAVDLIEARQEGIFHVDLRLRPYGSAGGFASPLAALEAYYRPGGDAAPWERQALIKLRWVAGDEGLGREVEALRDRFVYGGDPWPLDEAVHLRGRQARELVPAGRVNIKYSPGGIVDVEYTAQYLQVLHGPDHPELRTSETLSALDRLGALGILGQAERDELVGAYLFLRRLVDALRMVRGSAKDLLLPDRKSDEFSFLARRLSYRGSRWDEAAGRLAEDIRLHMGRVSALFAERFIPPENPASRLWRPASAQSARSEDPEPPGRSR